MVGNDLSLPLLSVLCPPFPVLYACCLLPWLEIMALSDGAVVIYFRFSGWHHIFVPNSQNQERTETKYICQHKKLSIADVVERQSKKQKGIPGDVCKPFPNLTGCHSNVPWATTKRIYYLSSVSPPWYGTSTEILWYSFIGKLIITSAQCCAFNGHKPKYG